MRHALKARPLVFTVIRKWLAGIAFMCMYLTTTDYAFMYAWPSLTTLCVAGAVVPGQDESCSGMKMRRDDDLPQT